MKRQPLALTTAGEHYLTSCQIEEKTPKTRVCYRQKLGRFIRWQGGEVADLGLERERKFVRRPEPLGA